MKNGFVKVAAASPVVRAADTEYNKQSVLAEILRMKDAGAKIMVLPELCLSSYECRDLFLQPRLLAGSADALDYIRDKTASIDALIFIGLPVEKNGKLYNAAAVLNRGNILAFIPKRYIPNHSEFYEARYFVPGNEEAGYIDWMGEQIPFGTNIIFKCAEMPHICAAAEICEDLWVPQPPSVDHALAGATIIANLSASNEVVGKDDYRLELVRSQSARLVCGYIYSCAGYGESSTDLVFGAHNIISENGRVLKEAERFKNELIVSEIDVDRLCTERCRMTTFPAAEDNNYTEIIFNLQREETVLTRTFPQQPFVPSASADRNKRCEDILNIQALGLKKRIEHTHTKSVVVGISGGLDSTLALIAAVRAYDLAGKDRSDIIAVTMPCFGTTDRTYTNACKLIKSFGATFKEVNIKRSVELHFEDIGQDPALHDVTFENAQARERTQVLMDIANMVNGFVVGTGDLSELALGWATYNGDHMSMYGVNGSIPKTLVRHLVRYYADTCEDKELSSVLYDVLDTPVSPELLPPEDGKISQKTEDIVGPYELHDFFLYYMLRTGFEPAKIYRIAVYAFKGVYDEETLLKWLKNFYRRFFSQQFKRSCLPDGPKVGSVAVSPRGDLRMPSDACADLWLAQLAELE